MWKCPAARQQLEFKVNCNFYGKVLRNMNYIDHTHSSIFFVFDNHNQVEDAKGNRSIASCRVFYSREECFLILYLTFLAYKQSHLQYLRIYTKKNLDEFIL